MSGIPPRLGAFLARRTFRKSSLKGSPLVRGEKASPNADPDLIFAKADLAPDPSTGAPDNLLKGGDKPDTTEDRDLTITLPFPAESEPADGDTVELVVDGVPQGDLAKFSGGTDVTLTLKATAHASPGEHRLGYLMHFPDNVGTGPEITFIVDYKEPGPDLSDIDLLFDPSEGLTPERLDANGDLPVHIFGYIGLAIDDQVILIIDGAESPAPSIIDHIPEEGTPILVAFPKAMIDALEDKSHDLWYRVTDRAGNKSVEARKITVVSLIKKYIDDLVKPDVEQTAAPLVDDAVSRSDGGVTVTIPPNAKLTSAYTAIIYWGSVASDEFALPANVATAGASYVVPYGTVYDGWFATSAGADVPSPTNVRYEIFLNGLNAGNSPDTAVNVNLFLGGGPDIDPETPEHSALVAPTVHSSSGQVNLIPIDDFDEPGTMLIPYMTKATPGPAVPVFIVGDKITVQYGLAPTFEHEVVQKDIDDAEALPAGAQFISFALAATTIEAGKPGTVPVTYTVTRKITGGDGSGTNISLSPKQDVVASSTGELPGGGKPLPAPTWPEGATAPNNAIGAGEALKGVNIVLPGYINKSEGDEIICSVLMGPGIAHAAGETPIDPPRTAEKTHIVGPDEDEDDQSSTVVFGTADLMWFHAPPIRMHAHITYTVKPPGGVHGAPSDIFYVEVDCRGDGPTHP
jgi:hypothetical protein